MPGKYSHSVVLATYSSRGIISLPNDQHFDSSRAKKNAAISGVFSSHETRVSVDTGAGSVTDQDKGIIVASASSSDLQEPPKRQSTKPESDRLSSRLLRDSAITNTSAWVSDNSKRLANSRRVLENTQARSPVQAQEAQGQHKDASLSVPRGYLDAQSSIPSDPHVDNSAFGLQRRLSKQRAKSTTRTHKRNSSSVSTQTSGFAAQKYGGRVGSHTKGQSEIVENLDKARRRRSAETLFSFEDFLRDARPQTGKAHARKPIDQSPVQIQHDVNRARRSTPVATPEQVAPVPSTPKSRPSLNRCNTSFIDSSDDDDNDWVGAEPVPVPTVQRSAKSGNAVADTRASQRKAVLNLTEDSPVSGKARILQRRASPIPYLQEGATPARNTHVFPSLASDGQSQDLVAEPDFGDFGEESGDEESIGHRAPDSAVGNVQARTIGVRPSRSNGRDLAVSQSISSLSHAEETMRKQIPTPIPSPASPPELASGHTHSERQLLSSGLPGFGTYSHNSSQASRVGMPSVVRAPESTAYGWHNQLSAEAPVVLIESQRKKGSGIRTFGRLPNMSSRTMGARPEVSAVGTTADIDEDRKDSGSWTLSPSTPAARKLEFDEVLAPLEEDTDARGSGSTKSTPMAARHASFQHVPPNLNRPQTSAGYYTGTRKSELGIFNTLNDTSSVSSLNVEDDVPGPAVETFASGPIDNDVRVPRSRWPEAQPDQQASSEGQIHDIGVLPGPDDFVFSLTPAQEDSPIVLSQQHAHETSPSDVDQQPITTHRRPSIAPALSSQPPTITTPYYYNYTTSPGRRAPEDDPIQSIFSALDTPPRFRRDRPQLPHSQSHQSHHSHSSRKSWLSAPSAHGARGPPRSVSRTQVPGLADDPSSAGRVSMGPKIHNIKRLESVLREEDEKRQKGRRKSVWGRLVKR